MLYSGHITPRGFLLPIHNRRQLLQPDWTMILDPTCDASINPRPLDDEVETRSMMESGNVRVEQFRFLVICTDDEYHFMSTKLRLHGLLLRVIESPSKLETEVAVWTGSKYLCVRVGAAEMSLL